MCKKGKYTIIPTRDRCRGDKLKQVWWPCPVRSALKRTTVHDFNSFSLMFYYIISITLETYFALLYFWTLAKCDKMHIWTNRVVVIQKMKVYKTLKCPTSPNLRFCFTKRAHRRTLLDILCPYYYYIHCLLWMAATVAAAVALLALLLEAGAEYVDYPEFT